MSQIIITMENGKTSINITSDDEVDVEFPRGTRSNWFHNINAFGERLFQARRKTHFTQKTLGKELGVSQTAIVEWEKGRSFPKRSRIETIAKLCGTTPEYLITGEEPGHG
jgi:DNA-binding XRE family transcriptional regulator